MLRHFIFLIAIFTVFSAHAAPLKDTLTVGYFVTPPFVSESDNGLHGPSYKLWTQIDKEGFAHIEMKEMTFEQTIYATKNGKVDICISPLTITDERYKQMDFSVPYHIAYSSILTKKESGWQEAFRFIGSFFSINFFRAMAALAVVILIFGFLAWIFERKGNSEEFSEGIHGLWHGFWWSAVTMTTVGYGDKSPKTFGGRMVALVWMFTAIIIISGFTASIASSLTVNSIDGNTNTIADFKEKKLGTVANSATDKWLENNFFNNRVIYNSIPDLLLGLKRGEIDAVAYDRPVLLDILKNDTKEEFQLLPIRYNPQFYAMGFNRDLNNTTKQHISEGILRFTETQDWKILLNEYGLVD